MTSDTPAPSFQELGLPAPIVEALTTLGYETPSPIQAATIPLLLAGGDVLGQAQTGTGKTAAFALPVLSRIDVSNTAAQALVLVPTRELAIQVAEAFQKYAARLPGFHVLPIYGGQSYTPQLKGLKRGAQVIVATPGRVIDHLERGSLDLSQLKFLVLDEADEMLQMGFADDIEFIFEKAPAERQVALFSATMPAGIRRLAQQRMRDPREITIRQQTTTAPNIRQRFWLVSGVHKLDALTRLLEAERFDAMLVFVRTKLETTELAERLTARGFSAAELSGDIPQAQRERTIARLKSRQLDILVATDVAARGIDVERISHVVNYDIPYDSETYVHRIGRTGRAGRSGDAILFVAPRERNMLRIIEKHTRQRIEPMQLPTVADVNEQRVVRFKERITQALEGGEGAVFQPLLEQLEQDSNVPAIEIAAALAALLQGSTPFLLAERPGKAAAARGTWQDAAEAATDTDTDTDAGTETYAAGRPQGDGDAPAKRKRARPDFAAERGTGPAEHSHAGAGRDNFGEDFRDDARPQRRTQRGDTPPMETFRIEVGYVHGALPGNIVGAIANEAGVDGRHIGHIDIREDHSYVDLPVGMPEDIFNDLQQVQVRGTPLSISRVDGKPPKPARRAGFKPRFEDGPRPAGRRFGPRADGPGRPAAAGRPFKPRAGGPTGARTGGPHQNHPGGGPRKPRRSF